MAEKEAMSSAKLVQAENRADQVAAERETVAKVTVASDAAAEEKSHRHKVYI